MLMPTEDMHNKVDSYYKEYWNVECLGPTLDADNEIPASVS
jgi:hypothetical protein